MQRVIIPAKPEHKRLLRAGLVLHDPVRLAVFGDWLPLRRPRDDLGELVTRGFGADVEGRALEGKKSRISQ
jgi:hypothetical protein